MANKLREIFVKNGGDMKVTCDGNAYIEGENGEELMIPLPSPAESLNTSMTLEAPTLTPIMLKPSPTPLTQKATFTMKANGDIEWQTEPLKEVTLVAQENIDHDLVIRGDQNDLDKYVKTQLAEQLAKKMIEEDLIEIYSDFDVEFNVHKFRAKVKIVQE